MNRQIRKPIAMVCAALTLFAAMPAARAGVPADDLKQIEYRYYFRGKYPQAIEALQTFLARVDVGGDVALRANEFLAASHVLSGTPQAGKDVFARVITANPGYAGPDPTVFKKEVVDVYGVARSEYAQLALRDTVPATSDSLVSSSSTPASTSTQASKPIYKKWWFYAGVAAVAIAAGAAAGGGGDDPADAGPRGTVVIGVTVK